MKKILSVCNQKGGVGKTTTAVNLAACFAAAENKTILIDADAQCNATTGLGIDKNSVDNTLYDLLMSLKNKETTGDIRDSIIKTEHLEYLDVIPSSVQLAGAEVELVNVIARERMLKSIISKIQDDYDYIVIDCPPSLGVVTVNVLTASTSVVIPIQCEYYALEGLAELLNTIRLVQKNLNPELSIEGTLLTMYDGRLNLSKQVAEDVKSYFPGKVFSAVIPRNVKVSESPSFGKPVILYDIMSAGSERYFKVAKEIMDNE